MFSNHLSRKEGPKNKEYNLLGFYSDDPHIGTNGLTFDQAVK